ncbi:MAG: HDOD domain-containing protein [Polyangiales bacterium]
MTSPDSTAYGWGDWWRRIFTGSRTEVAPQSPPPSGGPSPRATGPQRPEPTSLEELAWAEHHPEFAPHARALGLRFSVAPACDPAQLESLANAVQEVAAQDETDPAALPTASLQILQLVARPNLELAELASVIQREPALAAAVLRVANSAGMGAAASIRTVRDAITRLGVTESGRVVGVVATQALFNPQSQLAQRLFGARLREIHVASAAAASGAAQLSMERGVGRSDFAFLGGMLHDVGKSLAIGALVQVVLARQVPESLPKDQLDALLERVHVQLGSRAQARWQLPDYLVRLCAEHHDRCCPLSPETQELHLVRVMSGLIALRARPQPAERIAELTDSLRALDLSPLQTRAIDAGLRLRGSQVQTALAG